MQRASGLRPAALKHVNEQKGDLTERSGLRTFERIFWGLEGFFSVTKTDATPASLDGREREQLYSLN